MHIDKLVYSSWEYRKALWTLAKSGRLHHVGGRPLPLIADADTEHVDESWPRTYLLGDVAPDPRLERPKSPLVEYLDGQVALGGWTPPVSYTRARLAVVPLFDGSTDVKEGSAEVLLRSFSGVRLYRIEILDGRQEPAQLILSDPFSDPREIEFAVDAGLVVQDPPDLVMFEELDVAGKHLLDLEGTILPWEVAAAAERITDVGWMHGVWGALARLGLEREHLQGARAKQRALDLLPELALTYRVHEVDPDELEQL